MKVYCVQMDLAWHDAAENRRRAQQLIRDVAPEAGSLLALPEMFASGFTGDVAAATDSPRDETAGWCTTLAAELDCTIIAGLVTTARDGRGRNQALVCGPAGEIGRYTKIHPFRLGGEADQYQPGERPLVLDVGSGTSGIVRIAPLVCYDLRFPETFREAALEGVDAFVVIANWPSKRQNHWHALLRARAIENQAIVIGINRTGSDPNLAYAGGTSIYDHNGQALLAMDELPGVASATLDLAIQRQARREMPFLSDFLERHREQGLPAGLGTGVVLSD